MPRGRPLQAGEDCSLEATPTALSSSVSITRILAVIEALCRPSKRLLGMYVYASGRPRIVAVACSWGQGFRLLPGPPPHLPTPRGRNRSRAQQGTEVVWRSLSEHLDTLPRGPGPPRLKLFSLGVETRGKQGASPHEALKNPPLASR